MTFLASVVVGSRVATRVRVLNGCYTGRRGYVVRVVHEACIMVRLRIAGREIVLPFGPSELVEVV